MADQTVLGSAVRTATTNSAQVTWTDAKAYMVVDVTDLASTPSVVPKVQVYDSTSDQWITIASFTAITATGTYTYCLTDQSFAPATVTDTEQCYLTPRMRVRMEHADADSITYSVSFLEVNAA